MNLCNIIYSVLALEIFFFFFFVVGIDHLYYIIRSSTKQKLMKYAKQNDKM